MKVTSYFVIKILFQLSKKEEKALDLITKIGCGFAILCLIGVIVTFSCVRFVFFLYPVLSL